VAVQKAHQEEVLAYVTYQQKQAPSATVM